MTHTGITQHSAHRPSAVIPLGDEYTVAGASECFNNR